MGQHVQDGTYRLERHDGLGHAVAKGKPIKPRGLNKNETWLWKLVVQNWTGAIDTAQLRQLCAAWHCFVVAADKARQDPMVPEHRIAFCQYSATFDKLASKFGLNPSDRSRIKVPHGPDGQSDDLRFFGMTG